MPYFPTVDTIRKSETVVDSFGGYNHNLRIGAGEFYDMKNLTSSYFPLIANRPARGEVLQLSNPLAMIGKAQLAYIDGTNFFYNGVDLTSYFTAKGMAISTTLLPKQLVGMGAYICIFPDKLYINTENYSDCGSMESSFALTLSSASSVSYSMCRIDGSAYETPTISPTAPTEPQNGDLWIDTSGNPHSLKVYSSLSEMWTSIPTVYTKITATGIGAGFNVYDGVNISGLEYTGSSETMTKQIADLNGSKIIYATGTNYIVVVGLVDVAYTQTAGNVSVGRKVPAMDYVTEAQNRLWGCKYGLVDGKTVNEIYCCALGDFKNWEQYLGVAADSYRASVGTDGEWTGAITHLGYPIFFKENYMHKVYVSTSGAHQIVDTACRGVQQGSSNSLCVVDDHLFYKSDGCVCTYDGSLPMSVSDQFGTEKYYDASAGALNSKYYICMRDTSDVWHLFVYDAARGIWHHEDNVHAVFFARDDNELFYVDADTRKIMSALGTVGQKNETVHWMAESGTLGLQLINNKYVSSVKIRMHLPRGSEIDMFVQYDSDGIWRHAGHMRGTGMRSFETILRPRRCDHFRFRLEGRGDVRIYSISKVMEEGTI